MRAPSKSRSTQGKEFKIPFKKKRCLSLFKYR